MPRNFNLGGNVTVGAIREPRVLMRALIGLLLVANLVGAVIAFKPFGGSASDLQRDQAALELQLTRLQARLAASRKLVEKVQTARQQGDGFLAKYFMDSRTASSVIDQELLKDAQESGIKQLPTSYEHEALEGSDTLEMLNITEGLEGTYENLTKFINLVDKSPRFMIVDGMQTTAPQQNGKLLNVQIKIHAFARSDAGAAS